MKTLKFKCTLLTDIILNVKSASEGANSTLDFIPGSCFLGIAAGNLYGNADAKEAIEIFHSGKVKFGDAHPADEKCSRSLRIPASFFFAKGDSIKDAAYIHHNIKNFKDIKAANGAPAQIKQCRNGFYVMSESEGYEIKTEKSFAIKSAYDRNERRSKDAAMYGYESLSKGLEMLFSVEVEDDNLAEKIKHALKGEKRVGRSRTAQYGLVNIEECEYDDVKSYQSSDQIVIYADSRLVFLDENGLPTFQPSVEQLLGVGAEGTIAWDKCQIRTFQYAPWNYKRQCYDTDRCGIEKGSVIVIENCKNCQIDSHYVGSYNNEGFGKIICNPIFLQSEEGENGLSKCKFKDSDKKNSPKEASSNSLLFKYLEDKKKSEDKTTAVYNQTNGFDAKLFEGKEKFASQWGYIRSIALSIKDNKAIKDAIEDYISHGVKKEDWDGKRGSALIKFMENNQDSLWESIINLASEMAKKCSKNGDKKI